MFKNIRQGWILFQALLIIMVSTCVMQATPYVIGMEIDSVFGAEKRVYTGSVIKFEGGNFSLMGAGSWNQGVVPNGDGSPPWDGTSVLSPQGNIGNYVYGTGGFAGNPYSPNWTPQTAQFWGSLCGCGSAGFYFQQNSVGGSNQVKLTVENSPFANITAWTWFDLNNPSILHPFFLGSDSVGATASFTPSEKWGLAVNSLYYSTLNNNIPAFTAWQDVPNQGVPEPGTYVLTGFGFAAFVIRRWRQSKLNN
jgi:hypothetical protein